MLFVSIISICTDRGRFSLLKHHIFGPVSSRRLGRSLGIDLVPLKTCTYDCVYCECGETTRLSTKREIFFPVQEVYAELTDFLSTSPPLDFITFSGSGEPTLSLSIGEVIRFLKSNYPAYRVAVLTNGSLLSDPEVRRDLLPADVVLPTLSTVVNQTFLKIHRPESGISLEKILTGFVQFRKEYSGEIWLEVFIIPGINTSREELEGLRKIIRDINPDRVQLNTLDRPGTEEWVLPATREDLNRIQTMLDFATTEKVEPYHYRAVSASSPENPTRQIYDLLKRRPCTADDIVSATGLHIMEVSKILRELVATHDLQVKKEERGFFYYFRK
jgi:wyosine [tRNA(Phe)-imidazoG37] synthetase (radical SAM superfamily)